MLTASKMEHWWTWDNAACKLHYARNAPVSLEQMSAHCVTLKATAIVESEASVLHVGQTRSSTDTIDASRPLPPLPSASTRGLYRTGLLLSLLQKCIRRRCTETALRATWYLLNGSAQQQVELLRRLPIILVEDAMLHPWLDRLVCFMVLCVKGETLSSTQQWVVLQCVQAVCEFDVPADRRCHAEEHAVGANGFECTPTRELLESENSLLFALRVRASYGGMHGDMHLLQQVHSCWTHRLHQCSAAQQSTVPDRFPCWLRWVGSSTSLALPAWQIRVPMVEQWSLQTDRDLLPCAVDFHCSDIVAYLLETYHISTRHAETLKHYIWTYRSAVYHRLCMCGQHLAADTGEAAMEPWWIELNECDTNNSLSSTTTSSPGECSRIDAYCMKQWRVRPRSELLQGKRKSSSATRHDLQQQALERVQHKRTQPSLQSFFPAQTRSSMITSGREKENN